MYYIPNIILYLLAVEVDELSRAQRAHALRATRSMYTHNNGTRRRRTMMNRNPLVFRRRCSPSIRLRFEINNKEKINIVTVQPAAAAATATGKDVRRLRRRNAILCKTRNLRRRHRAKTSHHIIAHVPPPPPTITSCSINLFVWTGGRTLSSINFPVSVHCGMSN